MVLTLKTQNSQQKNGMILTVKKQALIHPMMKFLKNWFESSLCDYSDAYILVTENINITGGNANTKKAFKNCAPFKDCRREINETFVDKTENINIAMPTYNLTEYSYNYSDASGSLWQFKR